MKILIVHGGFSIRGGGERYILETCSALTREGHEIVFLTDTDAQTDIKSGRTYVIPSSEGWRSWRGSQRELNRILRIVRPDLIFVHNMWKFLFPPLLKDLRRTAPMVLFVHHVNLFCPNLFKTIRSTGLPCGSSAGLACLRQFCCRLENQSIPDCIRSTLICLWRMAVCRQVDRIIVPSKYIKDELVRNGFHPERIMLLPYFTERKSFISQSSHGNEILWVGRFEAGKGFNFFVDVLEELVDLPWKAIVVGEGEGKQEAHKMVIRQGLGHRVSFLGYLKNAELDSRYSRAKVVVITSTIPESFCMVGTEAMAHRRPVVAFDVGGIREWLQHGSTGFAVPLGNTKTMAWAIRKLFNDTNLAEQMGSAGQAVVDARFRPAKHIAGLVQTFDAARIRWAQEQSNHGHRLAQPSK